MAESRIARPTPDEFLPSRQKALRQKRADRFSAISVERVSANSSCGASARRPGPCLLNLNASARKPRPGFAASLLAPATGRA